MKSKNCTKKHWWQRKIPGLQRGARPCLSCGKLTDAFCAGCGVTPYCSSRCQLRDWALRHRNVCHNLVRVAGLDEAPIETVDTADVAPKLRQPHTPNSQATSSPSVALDRVEDIGSDMSSQKKTNPGYNKPQMSANRNPRGGLRNSGNRSDNRTDNRADNRANARADNRPDGRDEDRLDNVGFCRNVGSPVRDKPCAYPYQTDDDSFDECWDEIIYKPQNQKNRLHKISSQAKSKQEFKKSEEYQPKSKYPTKDEKPNVEANSKFDEMKSPMKPVKDVIAKASDDKTKPLASVEGVMPARKLVPKSYVVETLSLGDKVLISVDSLASECRAKSGFVCLSLHESVEGQFESLCAEYGADCDNDQETIKPAPGETFSFFNPEDMSWYRARCLSPDLCALLDGSKVVTIGETLCKKLNAAFATQPEFSCVLQADCVKIGDSLRAMLVAKTDNGFKVQLQSTDQDEVLGEGVLSRWLPEVQYPSPVNPVPAPAPLASVDRPSVGHGCCVALVHCASPAEAFVRAAAPAAQRAFDLILQDVVQYAVSATPLKKPPSRGQMVISKFTDGLFYRALVKRTNVKGNRYQLEYCEFGNVDITQLENIYPCPPSLSTEKYPVMTSQVILADVNDTLTPPAIEYLDKLRDNNVELLLTIPSGAKTAASGSAVVLTVKQTNEVVNRKLADMCKPDWEKLQAQGVDVVETPPIMFSELEYMDLPAKGSELVILDFSAIKQGLLSGYDARIKHAEYVLGPLTEKMAKYCDSEIGKEPYLPKNEELCIAKCPGFSQWFRAVLVEQVAGAGGQQLSVLYVDYGNIDTIDASLVRKMVPDFVRGVPALVNSLEIRNFPQNPTEVQLMKALVHLEVTDEGRGTLRVTRCAKEQDGLYTVDAPALIAAMTDG